MDTVIKAERNVNLLEDSARRKRWAEFARGMVFASFKARDAKAIDYRWPDRRPDEPRGRVWSGGVVP
jgi:hypothetical protein